MDQKKSGKIEVINGEKKPEDVIKGYKMEEGDYRISVRVFEAEDLIPTVAHVGFLNFAGQIVNSYVMAECIGKKKKSNVIRGQLSPIFNSQFSFLLKSLNKEQLEQGTLRLSVMDKRLIDDAIIGTYELDLTSVYFKLNHELFRTWLPLTDPTNDREGIMGYILVNISILGPNDEPFVHDATSQKIDTSPKETALVPGKIQKFGHQITISLLRGENMPPLDLLTDKIDAYVQASYSGNSIKSSVVTSKNPIWQEELNLACTLPNQSKSIYVQVYDRDLLDADDLVGSFNLNFKQIQYQKPVPRWVNLYGSSVSGKEKFADQMNLYGETLGSTYRGRILYLITSSDSREPKTSKKPLKYQPPNNPEPFVEQKTYTLHVDILWIQEIPQRHQAIIQVQMGPYYLTSKSVQIINGRAIWNEQLEEKIFAFPQDLTQVPDLIFYFADESKENRRHSFCRVNASLFNEKKFESVLKLKEDKSQNLLSPDEFSGFLSVQISMTSLQNKKRQPLSQEFFPDVPYELRMLLYIGRNLPPSDADGASDPIVKVRCAGQISSSSVRGQTLNPDWYETLTMNVKLQPLEKSKFEQGMMVMVYDRDEDENKYDLIGRSWVTFSLEQVTQNGVSFYWHGPKWYNLHYDDTDQIQGKILLGYALIPQADSFKVQIKYILTINKIPKVQILPATKLIRFNVFCVGLRDIEEVIIDREPKQCQVEFSIQRCQSHKTDEVKIKQNGMDINQMLEFEFEVPKNTSLCPIMEIRLNECSVNVDKMILGIGKLNFSKIIERINEKKKQKLINNLNPQPSKGNAKNIQFDSFNQIESVNLVVPNEGPTENKDNSIITVFEGGFNVPTNKQQQIQQDNNFENLISTFTQAKYQDYDLIIHGQQASTKQKVQEESIFQEKDQSNFISEANSVKIQINESTPIKGYNQRKKSESITTTSQFNVVQGPKQNIKLLKQDGNKQEDKNKYDNLSQQIVQSVYTNQFVSLQTSNAHQKLQPIQNTSSIIQTSPNYKHLFEGFGITSQQYLSQSSKIDDQAVCFTSGLSENQYKGNKEQNKLVQPQQKGERQSFINKSFQSIINLDNDAEIYKDYDTDPGEDLDITPEFLKGRNVLLDDLEGCIRMNKRLLQVNLKRGQKRGFESQFLIHESEKVQDIGIMKYIFLESDEQNRHKVLEKTKVYQKLMKSKQYVIRLYIMEGMQIMTPDVEAVSNRINSKIQKDPDLYIKLEQGGKIIDLKHSTLQKATQNPQFYFSYESLAEFKFFKVFQVQAPLLKYRYGNLKPLRTNLQGEQKYFNQVYVYQIDLETRFFSKEWQKLNIKPMECRNLLDESNASAGRLQLWIDLVERCKIKLDKVIKIFPPPRYEFEVRCIVWQTKDCVFKDELEKCNDIFVKVGLGGLEMQETDVHWRCRGIGSFNWRTKFSAFYPLKPEEFGTDQLKVQLWDKDIVEANDLIGETTIKLDIHKIIQKACKRQSSVQAKMKFEYKNKQTYNSRKKGDITNKIWFDVYHPEVIDKKGDKISQGKVQLSMELVPIQDAKGKYQNGFGREARNMFPTLPEPIGRLTFDIYHPLDFIKSIIGPDLYKKICFFLFFSICMTLVVAFGYQLSITLIGGYITKN